MPTNLGDKGCRCAKKGLEKESMHSTIDAQLPQKLPKQKTCQTPRKWVISDYPLLNCITARKCEI